jgi:hypothetical protein
MKKLCKVALAANRRQFIADVEKASSLLSHVGACIGQWSVNAEDAKVRRELRQIELDAMGHSAACARIAILAKRP